MTEKDIKICGHGSNTPSLKNLYDYLTMRHSQKMTNGVRKELIAVRRLKELDTEARRQQFHDTYKTILGRNAYSQDMRQFVYTPYKGRFYSDCSSSGCATYQRCGAEISLLNTAGILVSDLFEDVNCGIKDGHILRPEELRVAEYLKQQAEALGATAYLDQGALVVDVAKEEDTKEVFYRRIRSFMEVVVCIF